MAFLVLVRHGLSDYNKQGLWTGWTDVPLAPEGIEQAQKTGEELKDIYFDVAYVSDLKRTRQTLDTILSQIAPARNASHSDAGGQTPPITHSPAFNERNYGIYTGKNKWEVKAQVGDEEFQKIRRSWDSPIPEGESLKQVYDREIPYFKKEIEPKLREGKNVIIVSSGNPLRALAKYLEHIPDDKISELEIGTGEAYVYQISVEGKVESKEIRGVNENKGKI